MATYDLSIDGQGYLLVPGSYRRSGPGGGASWSWWGQRDWRGGDGQRVRGKDPARWRQGYGVAVADGTLRLAALHGTSFASGMAGWAAICGYGSTIYAGASGSAGFVYSCPIGGGDVWGLEYDTGKTSCRSMAVHGGVLYVGSGADGVVFSYNGTAWGTAFTIAGASAIAALCSYPTWDTGTARTVWRLAVGVEYSSGEAKVFVWDGSAAAEVRGVELPRIDGMCIYEDRVWVACSDRVNLYRGRLLGVDVDGEWVGGPWLEGDYFAGLAVFDGLLWAPGGGARIYASDGARLVEACDVALRGVTAPGFSGLAAAGGLLYVAYQHPTDGAALLCKVSASRMGDDSLGVVAAGGRPEWAAAGRGWHMGPGSGVAGATRGIGQYRGVVYWARDAAGAAPIYKTRTTQRAAGQCELSEWVVEGEGPSAFRRVVVEHDALAASHSVAVYASVDGAAYVLVGTSETDGATSAMMEFAAGTKGRRLGVRLNLTGSGGATPVVRGVGVEWAPAGEVKRRWSFKVRCEGVTREMLRKLDGSWETSTGAQLSAALWASRTARGVTLVDVGGVSREAWFTDLVEETGGLDQRLGAQTQALCELVEG